MSATPAEEGDLEADMAAAPASDNPGGPAERNWVDRPWGRALLGFLVQPAVQEGSAALDGLPDWMVAASKETSNRLKTRLWHGALEDTPETIDALIAGCNTHRPRLALLPGAAAVDVIARAAAWLQAPRLATLIRTADVENARATVGEAAWQFGLSAAVLLPPPAPALLEAVQNDLAADVTQGISLMPGAALFGLALGVLPVAGSRRLAFRTPRNVWAMVVRCTRDTAQGEAAFAAIRRVSRGKEALWSDWLD